MKLLTPQDLLIDQIRDLYSAEEQVIPVMLELAHKAPEPSIRNFFTGQEQASRTQRKRLEKIAGLLDAPPGGDTCRAREGLIQGGNEHIDHAEGPVVTALILIAHTNRILHYQIAGYGFAYALAQRLEINPAVELLGTSLEEERKAAGTLAALSVLAFGPVEKGDGE